jgi:hypothetical protein
MRTSDHAEAFARWWVDRYTAALPAPVAERRRSEIRSDVWEHRAWATGTGATTTRVAAAIVRRVVVGMAADLWWRHTQLAAARSRPRAAAAGPSSWMRRTWWQALAVLVGVIEVATGASTPFEEPTTGGLVTGALTAAGGLLALAGVAVRRHRRVLGDLMTAVGMLPVVPWYWTYAFPITAVAVVAASLVDAADALSSAKGPQRQAADPVRAGLVTALIAVLVGGAVVGSASAAVLLVTPALALLIIHAIVRDRGHLAPATRVGLLLLGAGVANGVLTVAAVALSAVESVTLTAAEARTVAVVSTLAILAGIGLLAIGRLRSPHDRASRRTNGEFR